jgi:predicted HTH transcriptional regulator
MDSMLIEELLNESESSTLDFKRDQYRFENATDEEKSELLKDILAFANAWRRTDGYILIGVEEVKGGRSKVTGIGSHIDDAKIQQFVNGKTNRPIILSYQSLSFEGVQIGIIHIPPQERPFYLKKDFGKLKQNEVYLRRGSSTDIATPDEIAKMGKIKIREIIDDLSVQPKSNPTVEILRREMEQGNIVLVHVVRHRFASFRLQCKVIEVNDLYANFRQEPGGNEVSGAISQITVSYVSAMKMKLFTIAPVE